MKPATRTVSQTRKSGGSIVVAIPPELNIGPGEILIFEATDKDEFKVRKVGA